MSKKTDRENYCMYLNTDVLHIGESNYEYVTAGQHTLQFDFGNMIEGTNRVPVITPLNGYSELSATDYRIVPVFFYKESRAAMKPRLMNFQHPNDYSKLIGDYKVLGFLTIHFDQWSDICKLDFVKNRIEKDKEKIRDILDERKKAVDTKAEKSNAAEKRRKIRELQG